MNDLMTPREAAAYLHTTVANLEYLRKTPDGPPFSKLGRQVRYRRSRLDQYLEATERSSTPSAPRPSIGIIT